MFTETFLRLVKRDYVTKTANNTIMIHLHFKQEKRNTLNPKVCIMHCFIMF